MSLLLPRLFTQSRNKTRFNPKSKYHKTSPSLRGFESLEDRLALSAASIAGDGVPAIEFSLDNQWQSGYTGNILIHNDEIDNIDGWTLEFDLAGGLSSIWNAQIASVEGDHYTVENASWNGSIDSGATVSFGFVADTNSSNLPENFIFNGKTSDPTPDPDPDPDPAATLTIENATITEGDTGSSQLDVNVRLSRAVDETVTVQYSTRDDSALAGSDYQSTQGTLTFAPGQTTATVSMAVYGDSLDELDESFFVELSSPAGAEIANASATVTILDNDEPLPDPPVGDAAVKFEVTSDWGSGFGGNITITNTDTSDLDSWVLEFNFAGDIPAGSIWSATIASHQGDHYVVNAESWNGHIAAGASVSFGFNGSRADASIVPTNFQLNGVPVSDPDDPGDPDDPHQDPPALLVGDVRISEGDSGTTEATLRLVLSKAADAPISVSYATADATATAGQDYNATDGTVTFEPGETEKSVTLSIVGDTAVEATETFAVMLATVSDLTIEEAQVNVTIVNDDFDPNDGGKRVLAYFAEWGIYGRDYMPMDIPAENLTHVVYAFANISDSGEVIVYDSYAATEKAFPGDTWDQPLRGNFNQLLKLKEANPHLRTMIAVGGWTLSGKFSDAVLTEASRELFAASAVEFAVEYGFDGIDLDWEYPGGGGLASNVSRPEDGANYTLFVKELREQLDQQSLIDGNTYEISVASPAGYDKMANFDLAGMADYIDWFNVMTYDYHGAWENSTNHQASLYASPDDPSGDFKYNIDYTIQGYIDAGVAPDQLSLGIPLYSRAWSGVSSQNNGLYQSAAGAAPGDWEAGMYDYKFVHDKLQNEPQNYTRYWDEAAMVPYVYSPENGGTFITYEDRESVNLKIDYVMEHELGGVFFWELSGDVEDPNSPDSLVSLAADRVLAET